MDFHTQKLILQDLSIFDNSNLVLSNLYQFYAHNVHELKVFTHQILQ